MRCKQCNGSNIERDESTGNSFCGRCGTLQEYDNYDAQLGGINGPQGTYIRVGTTGIGSALAYNEKKIFEANNLIEYMTDRFNLSYKTDEIKSMIDKITDGEFGQGEWYPILIGACCYAVVRKEGKGVLSMEEVACEVGCELHQLGSMVKRVVKHLELEFREFDLVGLFTKTASNSPRLSDVDREKTMERIKKQGAFLMNCSVKWFLSTGRRPMPLVVAVLAFVVQLNGVKVKIEDLAKDAHVSVTTCKTRYKELSEKLVKVAHEVKLPWAKDITVKNVVKHSGTLIGLMEAKSMRKRKEKTGDVFVRSGGFCLDEIVRDCLNKESMYCYDDDHDVDDDQDAVSRYFDVGGERQLSLCNSNDDDTSVKQLSTMYKEFEDKVRSGTLAESSQGNNNSTWQRRSVSSDMVSCADWWKGKSKLSQKLLLKEVLEKDVGLEDLPPSYIKGCVAVERRREKIKAAKLRINAIRHPSDVVSEGALSLEVEHSKKKRKRGSEIDWEDLVIQTLVLHDVNEEEIEKGHYKTLLDLHVFNSGEL